MDKLFTWDFWKAAFVRVLHTMAQTALGMITVGMTINEVNWLNVLSVSAVAGVISLLKSIVVSVPELERIQIEFTPDFDTEYPDIEYIPDENEDYEDKKED